jgi:hypothetical protein
MLFGPTKDRTHAARAQLADEPETARKTRSEKGVNLTHSGNSDCGILADETAQTRLQIPRRQKCTTKAPRHKEGARSEKSASQDS